jgi:hypothetical protein
LWSGVFCRGISSGPLPGELLGLATPSAAQKGFFDDNGGKAEQKQGKDNPQYDPHAGPDIEKIFIGHNDSQRL